MQSTVRLFDEDPYGSEFDAVVLQAERVDGNLHVILDRTFFYPESGGQPGDLGTLADLPVLSVTENKADGTIIHVVEGGLSEGREVRGVIDRDRRFDHMQQHSGQHILSAVFLKMLDAVTVGFHLSTDVSTVDFLIKPPSADGLAGAERAANRVIYENRPVSVKTVTGTNARTLPLRKPPPDEEIIRIVRIEGVDMTACCGTHVRNAGEVGMIKILNCEKLRDGCRVTFVCGERALRDYARKNALLQEAGRRLTVGENELLARVDGLLDEQKDAKQKIKSLRKRLLTYESDHLLNDAETVNGIRMVTGVFSDYTGKDLQQLARRLCAGGSVVCLLGLESERGTVVVGKTPDLNVPIEPILKAASAVLNGRGGGSAGLAQTSGPDPAAVRPALLACEETFRNMVKNS